MAFVSIITIIMFSLLAAATVISNMAKSRTNAFVDSSSAFYVAEAGLNKRAAEINKILKSYSGVKTVTAGGPTGIGDCFSTGIPAGGSGASLRSGTNDLECVNYRFQSSNNIANVITTGGNISLDSGGTNQNTYVAYTLVSEDRKNYVGGNPPYTAIPAGQSFAGLNALSYTYVVSAMGKKPVALPTTSGAATATAAKDSSSNTTLSMTFVNRVIPLFQFGIFYNGDLELNPTADMQVNGWVHSNANMYLQPAGLTAAGATPPTATFLSNVSAAGSIYNRVDAWTAGIGRTGITQVLLTGTSYQNIPDYSSSRTNPLISSEILAFSGKLKDSAAGTVSLSAPSPGFTRKRSYASNKIGEYFAKADMRLEMVPDRDVTSKATAPWTRDKARIPFNFTAIRTGGTVGDTAGTVACSTAAPAAGSDPAATYVDPERENLSALHCNVFKKGQLQSLRQPVMVLTNINQNRGDATTNTTFRAQEGLTLGAPTTLPALPTIDPLTTVNAKKKIIRALQVAIASTPTPISLDTLDKKFDGSDFVAGDLLTFKNTFSTLINNIPVSELSVADRDTLLRSKPKEIAALMQAWFLPAPIQRIERPTPDTVDATNRRSSGFYDGREQRWITMLQTNIASLSVWNRDGLYVDASNENLTVAYSPGAGASDATFALGTGTTNNTDGLAFDRVTTFLTGSTEIYPVMSLQYLGLGASDTTEGGLVFHATVSDDLDGSGGAPVAANDVIVGTCDNTNAQRILKKIRATPTGPETNELDASGQPIVLDCYRTYPGFAPRQSPFAFAFNGGNYLPSALMVSSDQSVYIQGNFNNNNNNNSVAVPANAAANLLANPINQPSNTPNTPSPDRLPAAIVADTITVLSNECIAGVGVNPLVVPLSQLSCGLPPTIDGGAQGYNIVTSAIAINAAFLSNTQVSNGNQDRYDGIPANIAYSGGANNYIRLLEDWYNSGLPFALNYSGSLVSLNQPIEYSGLYLAGGGPIGTSYYNIPFRNINYDTKFNTVTQLPPLTPKASYIQQSNFRRSY